MSIAPGDVTTPPVTTFDQADLQSIFQALMPEGPAWTRDPDSLQSAVCAALVPTYVRNLSAAAALIADIFPPTTGDLLPEWEATLGLPDPCAGEAPTTAGRIAQVVARFVAGGGQSVPYFIAYAANLGFTITIQEFTNLRCGNPCGGPVYNDDWAYAWQILPAAPTSILATLQVLICEFQRLGPAHAVLLYGAARSFFVLDSSSLDSTDVMT